MDDWKINTHRNIYVDICKGIAIYLVVLGHCIQTVDANFEINGIFLLIYSFHMPLFMLLSGYFFHPHNMTIRNSLKNNFCKLYVPSLTVGGVNCFFYVLYKIVMNETIDNIYVFHTIITGAWFLTLLFIFRVIGQVLLRCTNNHLFILGSLVILLLYFIPGYWMVNESKYLAPFFLLGYYCRNINIHSCDITNIKFLILFFIIFSAFSISFSLFDYEYTMYMMNDDIVSTDYLFKYCIRLVCGLTGSLVVIILCSLVSPRSGWAKYLAYLGTITLPIYVLHQFFLMPNRFLNFNTSNILVFTLLSFFIILLSYLFYRYTCNYLIFKKTLYGK